MIADRSALQCCNRSWHPAGQQPQPLPGGARSDPVGVQLNHGQVPGRDGRKGHHLAGYPVRRPGSQGRVIANRNAQQCCNRLEHPAGQLHQPLPSGAGSDSVGTCCWAMAMSPGLTADGGHHLVGNPVRRPGSQGRVIAGRSALQCCNCSRHPAGRQPQPLPGGARSDPVGVLLDHGQVPGRDGRQRPSPGGRRARLPGSHRGQEMAAVLQSLEVLCRPVTLPGSGHRWGAAGRWPSPRAGRQAGAITWWATRSGGLALRRG